MITRGTTPPTIIRQSITSVKQMTIPVLTVDWIIGDYYVLIKSKVNSNLWTEGILTIADRWSREKWEQLTPTEQEDVRRCVHNATSAALKVIHELGLPQEYPIPGESELDPSEALVVKSLSKSVIGAIPSQSTVDADCSTE